MPSPTRGPSAFLRPRRVAHAHSGTHSYLILTVDGKRVTGSVQFPVHDLEHALEIDLGGEDDGLLAAVADRFRELREYAAAHLAIRSEEGTWAIDYTGVRVLERQAGSYAILDFQVPDAPRARSVTIDYDGLLQERDHHEAQVIVRTYTGVGRMRTQREQEFTFSTTRSSAHVVLPEPGPSAAAAGTAQFVLAEAKEVARRVGKRLRR